jgi:proline dehydrogenase
LHHEPKNFQIAPAKIITDNEAATVEVFSEICNFFVVQRKESRFGDIQPGIFENFRTVELNDLIGLAGRAYSRNLVHHRKEEVFRKWVIVVPWSFGGFENPTAIHVKLNSREYELRACLLRHIGNGLRCRDDEERRHRQQLLHISRSIRFMTLLDRVIARTLPAVPKSVVRRVANRYIAGETTDDALRVVAGLNAHGFRATLDILGEHISTMDQAHRATEGYLNVLEEIARRGVDSTISIKLTQLGLKLDRQACLEMARRIVRRASELNNFVRIDMEDSSCTTDTLATYRDLRREFSNVGVVVQAYLRRTMDDVCALEDLRPNYRLCKGVYVEPREISYHDMRVINRNYVAVLERLLANGSYVGIATHDELMVWEALRIIRGLKLPSTAYEFQMLLGVEEQLRDIIRAAGHNVRVYIPFGRDWYAYSVRRLRENPRVAGYVFKAMFK